MDTIWVASVELWVVCGRLLWDRTSTKQLGCVWLFEKGCVRVQPGILTHTHIKKTTKTKTNIQTNGKKSVTFC